MTQNETMAVVGIGGRWSIMVLMMVVLITVVMVVVVEILGVQEDKCHRDKYPYHGLFWAINVLSVNAEFRRQDNSHISWAGMSQSQDTTRDNISTNLSGTSIHATGSVAGSGHNSESSDVSDGEAGDNRSNSHCEDDRDDGDGSDDGDRGEDSDKMVPMGVVVAAGMETLVVIMKVILVIFVYGFII